MSQFDDSGESAVVPAEAAGSGSAVATGLSGEPPAAATETPEAAASEALVAVAPTDETPVAAALRELDTLSDRELAEHPDVYQRIHAELQSALAAIDNA